MNILIAVIVLGVLVFVHEFGHFIVAKWANVYVEKMMSRDLKIMTRQKKAVPLKINQAGIKLLLFLQARFLM